MKNTFRYMAICSTCLALWGMVVSVHALAAPSSVVLSCAVAYLPQRSTWVREVRIEWDKKAIRSLRIDGLESHGFSLTAQGVMTAVDNERIQIDWVARQWQSDFRGRATGQGRCETVPG